MLRLEQLQQNKNYPEFIHLNLSHKFLSQIDNLQLFPMITVLNLSFNNLTNIEVLSYLVNIRELYLQHNDIANLKSLYSLKYLDSVDVSHNFIKDPQSCVAGIKSNSLKYAPQKEILADSNILLAIKLLVKQLSDKEKENLLSHLQ